MTIFQEFREALNTARQRSLAIRWTPNNVPEFREEAKEESAAWTVVFNLLDEMEKIPEEGDEVGEIAAIIEENVHKTFYARKAARAILDFLNSRKSPT